MKLIDVLLWIVIIAITTPIFYQSYHISVKKIKFFDDSIKNHVSLLSSFNNLPNCTDSTVSFPWIWDIDVSLCNKNEKIFNWLIK